MRHRLVLAVAIFALAIATAAHGQVARPASIGGLTLTAGDVQSDFDLLRHALEEAHPGLYRYSTKAEMDRGFDAERSKLKGAMTKPEFEAVVAETLALIRCGHTSMNPDEEFETAAKSARTFPLRVMMEGPRLMVMLNDTAAESVIQPGMEVLEINGHKAADIIARFRQVLSADGDIETGKRHDISGRFAKYYWWLIEQPDEFIVKARNAAGATVTTTLPGVTEAERKTNHNPANAPMMAGVGKVMGWAHDDLTMRFIKDPQIAEIRLKYFIGKNFPQWIENTFRTLHEKGAKTLIIDLRGNGGGEDEYGALLVSYLTDKPFQYFDHIDVKTLSPSFKEYIGWNRGFEGRLKNGGTTVNPAGGFLLTAEMNSGLALRQPGKYPFLGEVFILIEGGSFSCTADVCAVAHHLKRATFIGEETGGGYYGNNSGAMPTLTLPHSKVGIRFPLYAYWNAVPGYEGKRRGTLPDHLVEMKTEDVLRGVDAGLDLAVKLAGG